MCIFPSVGKHGGRFAMRALSAKFCREVTEPGRYYDGDAGLFLLVAHGKRGPRKSYVQRVTIHGKRRDIGLGSVRWLTLTDARARAQANRKLARMGGDPTAAARAPTPTFLEAVEHVLAIQRAGWRDGGKAEGQWRATIETYAKPLHRRPVDAITPSDVLQVIVPIWTAKAETARKLKGRISMVMKWAVAEGHRADDPVASITAALPKNSNGRKHHKALAYGRVSDAVRRVRESGAWWATKAAFEFMVLTAARSGEVRGARWGEIDIETATWTVPAERAKTGRPHRVPLTARAVAILAEARTMADGTGLLFPSQTGRVMSDMTISKLIKSLGIEAVPHGFRSSFRQWAAERTSTPREVAEHALAHVVGTEAERAYQRSDLFDRRRELMNAWARYLEASTATVVAIR